MRVYRKKDLFGVGIVLYGFANLLVKHPKDFATLIGHIFKDYIFEELKPAPAIRYIDTDFEKTLLPQRGWLGAYLSFVPFLIGSLGYLKWKFGRRISGEICMFVGDIKKLYSEAGYIFENAPTKLRYRQSLGVGLRILHFFDRPRNCFPSVHVILASYTYLKTRELINKYSSDHKVHARAENFLFDWSLRIIESCLMTKQHSLRDIAGGLAVVASGYPQFDRRDINKMVEFLFSGRPCCLPPDIVVSVRKEIKLTYVELMADVDFRSTGARDVLIDYVRRI